MNQSVTAKMTINHAGLMQAMVNSFVGTESIIKELAQNARRAKATRIDIKTLGTGKNMSLVVSDDGCGIDDFNSLLGLYHSGWDSSVQSESPYGIGFLSCILASKSILVMSNGKKLDTSSQSILEFKDIEIKNIDTSEADESKSNGTVIMLSGGKIGELEHIDYQAIFSGFDIPVFLNSVEIPRPNALDSGKAFEDTDAGKLSLHMFVEDVYDPTFTKKYKREKLSISHSAIIFYQGFYIGTLTNRTGPLDGKHDTICKSNYSSNMKATVLHLDHTKYAAIAPDRHCLVDADLVAPIIGGIVKTEIVKNLKARFAVMSEDFLLNSYEVYGDYGLMSLFNDLNAVPRELFKRLNSYPVLADNQRLGGDDPTAPDLHPTKEDIEGYKFPVFSDVEGDMDNEFYDFKYAMYCWKLGGLVMEIGAWIPRLDKDHWIWQHVLEPVEFADDLNSEADPITFLIYNAYTPELTQVNCGIDPEIQFCDYYTLSGPCGEVKISNIPMYSNTLVYFPKQAVTSDVILQVQSFQDDNDSIDHSYSSEVEQKFSKWIDNAKSFDNPLALLTRRLGDDLKEFPTVFGKNFVIKVNHEGNFVIEEQHS